MIRPRLRSSRGFFSCTMVTVGWAKTLPKSHDVMTMMKVIQSPELDLDCALVFPVHIPVRNLVGHQGNTPHDNIDGDFFRIQRETGCIIKQDPDDQRTDSYDSELPARKTEQSLRCCPKQSVPLSVCLLILPWITLPKAFSRNTTSFANHAEKAEPRVVTPRAVSATPAPTAATGATASGIIPDRGRPLFFLQVCSGGGGGFVFTPVGYG